MSWPGSYYDSQRVFGRGIIARDIAEPLISFDAATPAGAVRAAMVELNQDVAGVREMGSVIGYVECGELSDGACGAYAHPIDQAVVLADSAPITEVIQALNRSPRAFVRLLGAVGGIVTRADLQDPPVRMWLFGLVNIVEMRFLALIERQYQDESWTQYLSPSRLEKARALQDERRRRNQEPRLLDCLQFSDKAQIVVRNEALRSQAGFASRKRGEAVIKDLEALRNSLAHAQDIIAFDWDVIVQLSENLDRVIYLSQARP